MFARSRSQNNISAGSWEDMSLVGWAGKLERGSEWRNGSGWRDVRAWVRDSRDHNSNNQQLGPQQGLWPEAGSGRDGAIQGGRTLWWVQSQTGESLAERGGWGQKH